MSNKNRQFKHRISATGLVNSTVIGSVNSETKLESLTTGFEIVVGANLPRWKKIIKARGDATTSLTAQRSRLDKYAPASASHELGVYDPTDADPARVAAVSTIYRGYPTALPTPTLPGISSRAVNRAKSKFVSLAMRELQAVDGGVVLGELRETIRMIRNPAGALVKGISGYFGAAKKQRRSLQNAKISTKQKVLSNLWLEYSFGWVPFINDIGDGAKALQKIITAHRPSAAIRGFGSDEEYVGSVGGGSGFAPLSWSCNLRITDTTKAVVFGAISAENSATSEGIARVTGFNLSRFVPTIWELIPYSFLVDYLINVGQVLEAASFNTKYLKYCGLSSKGKRTWSAVDFVDNTPRTAGEEAGIGYLGGHFSPGQLSFTVETMNRIKLDNPTPSVQIQIKGSLGRLANVTALLAQHRRLIPF
jgi:hypothetical protein